jgi:5'(3')-deoxyribonucleotidase
MKVFLDMDGVIVDWDRGVEKLFGVPWKEHTTWDVDYAHFGMTPKGFWSHLDTIEFWKNLPWTRDGRKIWEIVKEYDPIILTHGRNANSCAGKVEWIKRELPEAYRRNRYLICGGDKGIVATPDSVLIDDSEEHCARFNECDGRFILYPAPTNENRAVLHPTTFLKMMLGYAFEDLK